MFCRNCGKELSDKAVACIGCGMNPHDATAHCPACGAETNDKQVMCVKCGVGLSVASTNKKKDKTMAALYALLVGGLGLHKFYHGSWGWGILYIIFCWTFIPAILGVIEGVYYLTVDSAKYDLKYNTGGQDPFKW
ncbi:MAG: NINE protein [Methylococcales bacterium]